MYICTDIVYAVGLQLRSLINSDRTITMYVIHYPHD
jgi:hypothetical protein